MNIDKRALREVAERATQGPWEMEQENIWFTDEDGYTKHLAYVEQGDDVDDKQDHYNTAYIAAANPATMLALLDELEHYKSREERVTKLVLDNSTSWDALYKKLEAAEKRIAELEARTVNLPKRSVGEVMHMSGFSRDYAEGWCAGNDNAIHEIRIAGIKVKGE
ncbi:ead/Ea22-like family protein [Salmonella enterica]|uniref:Ead/Ea22-like family protein n=2 Tax=Salmonella enterica TaxID=28901 RepID=A0A5Y2ZQF5_SALER|nr:ead/Ea22-like family protein [Salmonella enterica]EAA6717709.1 ead/Ea22-like family protein [Salmonella enterica subsp. enterica serovar Java]ECF1677411.1 ead/Ea22-like family protein [Salmonella enterica subsp. enterica]ECO0747865.1 ead/Ea22-like family protein [Salmonella enterica subsp. enterica serovar Senftenberg]ECY6189857.1 ead/Ea22-like family protein [Salmonella enterica subsp. enterica serovar Anatum]EHM9653544.1 ead/Ea22-like family protein [Salmonella enterica subsp. enterica se